MEMNFGHTVSGASRGSQDLPPVWGGASFYTDIVTGAISWMREASLFAGQGSDAVDPTGSHRGWGNGRAYDGRAARRPV